jgi:hypothetical protein
MIAVFVGVIPGFLSGASIIEPIWAALTSTAVGLIAAVQTFLRSNERAEAHKRASEGWLSLQEKARKLWEIDVFTDPKPEDRYQELIDARLETFKTSPSLRPATEKQIPATGVSIDVTPMLCAPGQKVRLSGTLITNDCGQKVVDVTFVLNDPMNNPNNPIVSNQLTLKTEKKGAFGKIDVEAPLQEGTYTVTACYDQNFCGYTKLMVKMPSAQASTLSSPGLSLFKKGG